MAVSLSVPFSRKHADLIDVSTPHATADIADGAITTAKLGFSTWEKIAEIEVTSNVGSVEFTGLDINTDKVYALFVKISNADSPNQHGVYIAFNGDTTTTNYYRQYIYGDGTTLGGSRYNDNRLMDTGTETNVGVFFIFKTPENYIILDGIDTRGRGGNIQVSVKAVSSNVQHTNLTSIKIYITDGNYIAPGSRFILCKVRTS